MTRDLGRSLTGISGILVTPLDAGGNIAPERQKPIFERAINAGIHILTANGDTGGFHSLTTDEAVAAIKASADHVASCIPLVAGVGRSIGNACRLAAASAAAGANALMLHQPSDPFVAPEGSVDDIRAVHEAGQTLPMVLHPRNDTIGTASTADIRKLPGMVGVIWATPNPMKLKAATTACRNPIKWVGGLAEVWVIAFYAVGAHGFASGRINVWPKPSVAVLHTLEARNVPSARYLIAGIQVFEDIRAQNDGEANAPDLKAAFALMGEDVGGTRPTAAWPLPDSQLARLKDFVSENNLS